MVTGSLSFLIMLYCVDVSASTDQPLFLCHCFFHGMLLFLFFPYLGLEWISAPWRWFGEGICTWIGWLQLIWNFNWKYFSTFERVKWYICFVSSMWKLLLQILVHWEFFFLAELHKITCLHFLKLLCTGKQLSCYICLNYLLLCWWVESMA